MEVYLIKCKSNQKVYIGSTRKTKEDRWIRNKGWASHVGVAYSENHKERDKEFYKDIRVYGINNFELFTLERVDNMKELFTCETKWIKYYIDLIGRDKIYNILDKSIPTIQLNTPKAKMKRKKSFIKTMKKKYGKINAPMMTKESREKAIPKIKKALSGKKRSPESIEKTRINISKHILYKGNIFIGIREFTNKLNSDGYQLTCNVVDKMVKGYFSLNNCNLYPELNPHNIEKIWVLINPVDEIENATL